MVQGSSRDAFYPRFLAPRIEEALADTPVVLINGPRQCGKTTLARNLAGARPYLTLDDAPTLLAARENPQGLIRGFDSMVIDEIQRAPGLLLAIKQSVDEERRPGRFLLTGSANLITLPLVADSLAGRIESQVLLPLAQAEIAGVSGGHAWLDHWFNGAVPQPLVRRGAQAARVDLPARVLTGGYPESVARALLPRRQIWARQYLNMLLQRDARELARIDKIEHLPRLLALLAHHAGQLCNYSQIGGQIGLDHKTTARYVSVLEQMFLLQRVPPWSANGPGRLVKTSKLHFLDAGLLAALLEISDVTPPSQRLRYGQLLESFVLGELVKFCSWSLRRYAVCFYRDKAQREVDFVVEDAQARVLGIEVKAAASVNSADFAGLRLLQQLAGERFVAGLVLYDGERTLPIAPQLWAVPITTLWGARFA